MDLEGIKRKIDREFAGKTDKFKAWRDKVALGKSTYKDATKLADYSGKAIADALVNNLEEVGTLTEAELIELVPHALRTNHDYLAACIENVQRQINKRSRVGLKPVVPAFNSDRATGLAKEIAVNGGIDGYQDMVRNQVINNSMNVIDEAIQGNARQHDHAGLEVIVEREYDGVGVHDGKDTCSWCLARAGTWSYSDAIDNGVFERHPGCGCRLTYTSDRGTDLQTDWRSNTWTRVRR